LQSKLRARSGLSRIAILLIVVILVVAASAGIFFYEFSTPKGSPLILYSADAYVPEATALESSFTNSTGIQTVSPKAGGSLLLGQEIAQGDPVSVFLSVSKSAVGRSVLNTTFPGWAISFATDQMSIAYSNATAQNSAAVAVLNSYHNAVDSNTTSAWYSFFSNLTSGSVKVGISDPNADPAGFRAWIVLQAAGSAYDQNDSSYFVNRMLSNHGNITGSSAADLVTPLDSGNIQFLFIYKSAALAQHLNIIHLQNLINLGSPAFSSFYSKFSYSITSGLQTGSVIALFITVPKDATNVDYSLKFVVYVIQNSAPILKSFGLGSITPARLYNDSDVPSQINELLLQGNATFGGSL
jgi:molybdate/tungstate transport system substrate-binding protein